MLLGIVIAAQSFFAVEEAWAGCRGAELALILAAPVVFGLTVRGLGLVGAVALAAATATSPAARRADAGGPAGARPHDLLRPGFSYGLGLPFRCAAPG